MKKININFLMGLLVTAFALSLEAADQTPSKSATSPTTNSTLNTSSTNSAAKTDRATRTQDKFDIMERDENEDSDTLAIPFDDSEVEDEEEINEIEHKNVFDLPHRR